VLHIKLIAESMRP